MEQLIPFFIGLIKDAPGYFVLTIGFILSIFFLYIKVRSINIDEITSIGSIRSEQMVQLLTQVSQLSKDLAEAREEISRLYHKIDELETVISQYRTRLRQSDIMVGEY